MGELEVDANRGVIYFHFTNEDDVRASGGQQTILRICNLPTPIPVGELLDITHMTGTSWGDKRPLANTTGSKLVSLSTGSDGVLTALDSDGQVWRYVPAKAGRYAFWSPLTNHRAPVIGKKP